MMMTGGGRRCSHCGNNGHNSRTCYDRKGCLKLFGVRILADDMENDNHHHHHQFHDEIVPMKKERNEAIKRSLSMGHLLYHHHQHLNDHHSKLNQNDDNGGNADNDHHGDDGYLSDGLTQYSYCKPKILLRRRKKGVPWTEEEHKTFLIGLKTLGKGDWRGISKNFVHTRTPTQVASHAQKYFMRQLSAKGMKKKKRRMSLFDLPLIGDLSINSPTTSPFASPIQESPPRQVENLINSSGDSSDNGNIRASTFHAHHSHALPPLSPQGLVFKALPYTLGLPSSASPNTVLASSMLEDMLELRIALPVGLSQTSAHQVHFSQQREDLGKISL